MDARRLGLGYVDQIFKYCWFGFLLTSLAGQSHGALGGDVIVYYANETNLNDAAKENYNILSTWLLSDSDPLGPKIAGQIASDIEVFQDAVKTEIAAIRAHAKNTNVVLFTNGLSVRKKALIFMKKDSAWSEVTFDIPDATN